MSYIVFDLEATCGNTGEFVGSEIIEIGAVKLNRRLEIIGEFNEFVKPMVYPNLSAFCIKLTSITQKDVDTADMFDVVVRRFQEWLGEDYLLLSWGNYDRRQFLNDCTLHSLRKDWLDNYRDFKRVYAKAKGIKPCGMKNALIREGIQMEGIHHRGIDDARNTAKLFVKDFPLWGLK